MIENNKTFWLVTTLGLTAVYFLLESSSKKEDTKGFIYNCETIRIFNLEKFDFYIKNLTLNTISTQENFKNPITINFYDFCKACLEKLNKDCYDKFINDKMKYEELIIVAIFFDLFVNKYLDLKTTKEDNYMNVYFYPQWQLVLNHFLPITEDQIEKAKEDLLKKKFYP